VVNSELNLDTPKKVIEKGSKKSEMSGNKIEESSYLLDKKSIEGGSQEKKKTSI